MGSVAWCQHPSVPRVKGHSVKHWHTGVDRGTKTEETILFPASLWDFMELCCIAVCSSLSVSKNYWFTEHYKRYITAVYPHICVWRIFAGSIHKHLQSSLANMKQWKVKEPGELRNVVFGGLKQRYNGQNTTFSSYNGLHSYVNELLTHLYPIKYYYYLFRWRFVSWSLLNECAPSMGWWWTEAQWTWHQLRYWWRHTKLL